MFVKHILTFVFLSAFLIQSVDALDAQKSTESLRKSLQEEMARARELQVKKRKLDNAIKSNQSNLKKFNQILRNYQYNLDQAQKVIDAAQAELSHIEKRNQGREHLFSHCLTVVANYSPEYPAQNPGQRMTVDSIAETIAQITRKIFEDMESEKPRMTELLQVIQNKQALQERILTEYMPVDMEKKETIERLVDEKTEAAEKTHQDSKEIQKHIDDLKNQIAAAEAEMQRRIAEQKRLAEKKRREEEEKRKKQLAARKPTPTPKPTAPLVSSAQSAAILPNRPITELQGQLIWPANGAIIKPFGEFTHPEYKVKMKSYGINIRVAANQSIRSAAAGKVFFTGEIAGFGPTVIVDHGREYRSVYANVKASVSAEQAVAAGQAIGKAGGVDLHFELRQGDRALNPLAWLRSQ